MKFRFALLCTLALAAGNALACYTVYDRGNQVAYHAQTPPVDMSLPLHETLPAVYPGGHMVFDNSSDCPRAVSASVMPLPQRAAASPLLTDRRTAESLNLPHTMLAGNVALVPPQAASRVSMPTFSVIPTDVATGPAAATQSMGAGPAPGAVITEMRDPPMTGVQQGKRLSISR